MNIGNIEYRFEFVEYTLEAVEEKVSILNQQRLRATKSCNVGVNKVEIYELDELKELFLVEYSMTDKGFTHELANHSCI